VKTNIKIKINYAKSGLGGILLPPDMLSGKNNISLVNEANERYEPEFRVNNAIYA
jgi:hypothetical protein